MDDVDMVQGTLWTPDQVKVTVELGLPNTPGKVHVWIEASMPETGQILSLRTGWRQCKQEPARIAEVAYREVTRTLDEILHPF